MTEEYVPFDRRALEEFFQKNTGKEKPVTLHLDKDGLDELRRKLPETVDKAVELLFKLIPESERPKLPALTNGGLANDELGRWIRNNFKLWGGNIALLKDTGCRHPDGASWVIIDVLLDRLRNTNSSKVYEPGEWRKEHEFIDEWKYVHVEPIQPKVKAHSFREFSSRIRKPEDINSSEIDT